MIVYQFENPDYGWITYRTLDDLMEVLKIEIEANTLHPCEVDLQVRAVEMTEEQYSKLEIIDE